jgi:hypothetical protein
MQSRAKKRVDVFPSQIRLFAKEEEKEGREEEESIK